MNLRILKELYQVIKLNTADKIPQGVFNEDFFSITGTAEELSIVTNNNIPIKSDNIEKGWKVIKIEGVLDFNLIGIISKISKILADNDISIFVISTFNTDYILVKEHQLEKSIEVLTDNNYRFD